MLPLNNPSPPLRPPLRRRHDPHPNPSPRQLSSTTDSFVGSDSSLAGPTSSFDLSSTTPSSFSSDSRPTTSQDTSASTPVSSVATFSSVTPTSPSTSKVSTPAPTSTPPPSSSHSSPTTPPIPSSPSSGFVFSTFTTSLVSDINGTPTTIVTPIVTSLRSSPPTSTSSRAAVVAGSAVAGLLVLLVALTALFIIRRRRRRQRYWALSRKRLPSRATFLASEEMDLPFPSPPFASAEHDDPFSSPSNRASSAGSGAGVGPYAQSFYERSQSSHTHALPPRPSSTSSPPRLLRARASESGSIFQESVWPPPSQLIDPLTSPSQSVNLARIVTDVMGPQGSAPDVGPLLLSTTTASAAFHERECQQEPEAEAQGEGDHRSLISPPLSLELAPPNTNFDDWPRRPSSDSQSHPQIQPPLSLSPPATPPPRTQWLSRSPNPSPKGSPSALQLTHPV